MTDAAEIAEGSAPAGHSKLQWRILTGFALGLVAGLATYSFAADAAWVDTVVTYVTGPIGQIFLRLLFMLVIPLLFSALVVGIAEMGEIRALKTVGIRTLVYTVVVSAIAVAVSIAAVDIIRPGAGGRSGRGAAIARAGEREREGHPREIARSQDRGRGGDRPDPLEHRCRDERERHSRGDVLRFVLRDRPAAGADQAHRDPQGCDRRGVRGFDEADRAGDPARPAGDLLLHVQPGRAVRLGPDRQARRLCRRGAAGAGDPDVRRVPAAA